MKAKYLVVVSLLLVTALCRHEPTTRRASTRIHPSRSVELATREVRGTTNAPDRSAKVVSGARLEVHVTDETGDPVEGVLVALVPPTEKPFENAWPDLLNGADLEWTVPFHESYASTSSEPFRARTVTSTQGVACWESLPSEYEYRYVVFRDTADVDPPHELPTSPFEVEGERITYSDRSYFPANISGRFTVDSGFVTQLHATVWNRTAVTGVFESSNGAGVRRCTLYELSTGRLVAMRRVKLSADGSFRIAGLEPARSRQLQFVAVSGDDSEGWVIELAQVRFECLFGEELELGTIRPAPGADTSGTIRFSNSGRLFPGSVILKIHEATRTREGTHNQVLLPLPRNESEIPVTIRGLTFDNTFLDAEFVAETLPEGTQVSLATTHLRSRRDFDLALVVRRYRNVDVEITADEGEFHGVLRYGPAGSEMRTASFFVPESRPGSVQLRLEEGQRHRIFAHTTSPLNETGVDYFADAVLDEDRTSATIPLRRGCQVVVHGARQDGEVLSLILATDPPSSIETRSRGGMWQFRGVPPRIRCVLEGKSFDTESEGARLIVNRGH